jgi:hypothetical protein
MTRPMTNYQLKKYLKKHPIKIDIKKIIMDMIEDKPITLGGKS